MEWFWSNPVITVNGYLFILFYFALIIVCRRILFIYENKLINQPFTALSAESDADPLFIAWLKDPKNGVCKMVMGPLLEEGYIKKKGNADLYQTTNKVKAQKTALEAGLLHSLRQPAALSQLHEYFQQQTATFRDKAEQLQLIVSQDMKNKILRFSRILCLALMALGIYRLIGSFEGADGFYLITLVMVIFFGNIISYNENRFYGVMISARGKDYLETQQKRLSASAHKNVQQAWLLKILSGGTVASELNARNDVDNSVYINLSDSLDSADSSCDASFDSSCSSND